MSANYCVVQYAPNLTGERINIGVITYDDNLVLSRFLQDWSRVKCFASGSDISFLREFAADASAAASPDIDRQEKNWVLDREVLERISSTWTNSIQLTSPRGSILDPDALLDFIVGEFLIEPTHVRRQNRTRQTALSLGYRKTQTALIKQLGYDTAKQVLSRRPSVAGLSDTHRFDFGVKQAGASGATIRPMTVADAFSFEGPDREDRENDIKVSAWAINDIRALNKDLPIAVLYLPPTESSTDFDRAAKIFKAQGVDFVPEAKFDDWATSTAEIVGAAIQR